MDGWRDRFRGCFTSPTQKFGIRAASASHTFFYLVCTRCVHCRDRHWCGNPWPLVTVKAPSFFKPYLFPLNRKRASPGPDGSGRRAGPPKGPPLPLRHWFNEGCCVENFWGWEMKQPPDSVLNCFELFFWGWEMKQPPDSVLNCFELFFWGWEMK